MVKLILGFLVWVSLSSIALASETGGYMQGEYIQDPDKFDAMMGNLPDWAPVLISVLLSLMLLFRVLSEILLVLADKIPGDTDKKAAGYLKSISTWLGHLLGQVGVGMPKVMVMEKAAKERAKPAFQENHDKEIL